MQLRSALLMSFLMLSSCAPSRRWSKLDVGMGLAMAAAASIDLHQTMKTGGIVERCVEANPLIGRCGERLSPYLLAPLALTILGAAAHAIPRGPGRSAVMGAVLGYEVSVVLSNLAFGAGL